MEKKKSADFILGLIVIGIAVLGTYLFIPKGIVLPDDVETRALSPDFWPLTIMILLGLSGAALMLQSKIGQPDDKEDDEQILMRPFAQGLLRVIFIIGLLIIMYYLIPYLGMPVSCAITFMIMTWFAGERRFKLILPIAIVLPLILYLFFVYIANVPLPMGIFEAWV